MNISKSKIEIFMAAKGINSTELAKVSGISRQNLSTIKNRGTCIPETAGKIARGLGVDVREIIEEE